MASRRHPAGAGIRPEKSLTNAPSRKKISTRANARGKWMSRYKFVERDQFEYRTLVANARFYEIL